MDGSWDVYGLSVPLWRARSHGGVPGPHFEESSFTFSWGSSGTTHWELRSKEIYQRSQDQWKKNAVGLPFLTFIARIVKQRTRLSFTCIVMNQLPRAWPSIYIFYTCFSAYLIMVYPSIHHSAATWVSKHVSPLPVNTSIHVHTLSFDANFTHNEI